MLPQTITDLLDPSRTNLQVRENLDGQYVSNLSAHECSRGECFWVWRVLGRQQDGPVGAWGTVQQQKQLQAASGVGWLGSFTSMLVCHFAPSPAAVRHCSGGRGGAAAPGAVQPAHGGDQHE